MANVVSDAEELLPIPNKAPAPGSSATPSNAKPDAATNPSAKPVMPTMKLPPLSGHGPAEPPPAKAGWLNLAKDPLPHIQYWSDEYEKQLNTYTAEHAKDAEKVSEPPREDIVKAYTLLRDISFLLCIVDTTNGNWAVNYKYWADHVKDNTWANPFKFPIQDPSGPAAVPTNPLLGSNKVLVETSGQGLTPVERAKQPPSSKTAANPVQALNGTVDGQAIPKPPPPQKP